MRAPSRDYAGHTPPNVRASLATIGFAFWGSCSRERAETDKAAVQEPKPL